MIRSGWIKSSTFYSGDNEKFLIQKHVEKGYWGSFEVKNYSDNILLLGLEIEGYTKTLLGYFYNEKNIVKFKTYSTNEVDTEGKSDAYEVYSLKNGFEKIY